MKYTKYYMQKLEEGKKYEKFIKQELYIKKQLTLNLCGNKEQQINIGENLEGIEIKFDNKKNIYKNIYIELQEKTNKNNTYWVNSGILRKDNTHSWIIGDYQEAFIFWKFHLKQLYKNNLYLKEVSTKTSRGFLLNTEMQNKYCLNKLIFNKNLYKDNQLTLDI
tara:strand:+ start:303 stop:794 length:492 start_codon:yes stop_codon:yes gene_type:complete